MPDFSSTQEILHALVPELSGKFVLHIVHPLLRAVYCRV